MIIEEIVNDFTEKCRSKFVRDPNVHGVANKFAPTKKSLNTVWTGSKSDIYIRLGFKL
jgi:hypothetical protein